MDSDDDDWFYDELYKAIEESDKEFDTEDIEEITRDTIENAAIDLYEDVLDDFSNVERHREEIAAFEDRLHDHWGDAFDKLEQLIYRCYQLGAHINHEDRFEAAQEQDYLFEALTRLHARACQIAYEILALIKHGFADGAFARWRSLHEIAVITLFIKEHGQETAERFLLFETIETYYFAQNYMEHHDELGHEPISEEVLEELETAKEDLVDRFGEVFDDEYGPGWALHVFENQSGGVRRLEKEAGLEHRRPFYRLASKSVHGTPKGTLDRIGVFELPDGPERPEQLPAGPTNAGFTDPAVLTAVSLNQVTHAMVTVNPTIARTVEGYVNNMLIEDLRTVFSEKADELREDEREALDEWANMDIPDIARVYLGFGELLTDKFLEENTEFDSGERFLEAVPFEVDSLDELNADYSEEFEDFVAECSDFGSGDELAEGAFEHWVETEVDFSEFDFEE
jgi:hypothetical protein